MTMTVLADGKHLVGGSRRSDFARPKDRTLRGMTKATIADSLTTEVGDLAQLAPRPLVTALVLTY
jgi:hypothetical protein